MTEETPHGESNKLKENWQILITIGLLLGFGGLVWFLTATANGSTEIVWQRRVFVLGGVEALVFTAIGWLFGREVSRSAVASAQKDASDAKKDAEAARGEAQQQTEEASKARTEAAAVQARAETAAAVVDNMTSAAESRPASGGSRDAGLGHREVTGNTPAMAVDLQGLFRQIFPRQ